MNRSNVGSATLFFLHGVGLAAWFVPLSPVLEAHGLGALRPYAFATSAVVNGSIRIKPLSPSITVMLAMSKPRS